MDLLRVKFKLVRETNETRTGVRRLSRSPFVCSATKKEQI